MTFTEIKALPALCAYCEHPAHPAGSRCGKVVHLADRIAPEKPCPCKALPGFWVGFRLGKLIAKLFGGGQ